MKESQADSGGWAVSRKMIRFLVLLFAAVIITAFLMPRFAVVRTYLPVGSLPFENLHAARVLLESGFVAVDNHILYGRLLVVDALQVLMAVLLLLFPSMLVQWGLPILLMAVFLILLFKLVFPLMSTRMLLVFMVIFIASSSFIVMHTAAVQVSFALVLVAAAALCLMHGGRTRWLGYMLVVSCGLLLGFYSVLFAWCVLLAVLLHTSQGWKSWAWLSLSALAGVVLAVLMGIGASAEAVQGVALSVLIVSDFGGFFGYGIFHWILLLVGIVASWHHKRQLFPLYIFLIVLFAFGRGDVLLLGLAWPLVAFFCALALVSFLERSWEVDLLRQVTIIVLSCGLLFSLVSFVNEHHDDAPGDKVFEAMNWLGRATPQGSVVLAPADRGDWIMALADRTVLFDARSHGVPQALQRRNASDSFYKEYSLLGAQRFLYNYSIGYIYIDRPMREGEVWDSDAEAFFILLRDNETFKKEYSNSEVEIWKVLPRQVR